MAYSSSDEDAPVEYDIEYAESAELELESAYLFRSTTTSPESAARWVDALRTKVENLRYFPHGYSRSPEYEESGADVRRLLHQPYRILYQIIEPENPGDHGIVRILHIWHGSRRPAGDAPEE